MIGALSGISSSRLPGPGAMTLVSLLGGERSALSPLLAHLPGDMDVVDIPVHDDPTARRAGLAAQIDTAVTRADRNVMLVGHGVGCLAAAWWARLSPRSYVDRVAGSLMVAPTIATASASRFASPASALPFPSLVIGADDTAQRLAAEWGGRLLDGPLPTARQRPSGRLYGLVARFTAGIVERDVQAAERLLAAVGDS